MAATCLATCSGSLRRRRGRAPSSGQLPPRHPSVQLSRRGGRRGMSAASGGATLCSAEASTFALDGGWRARIFERRDRSEFSRLRPLPLAKGLGCAHLMLEQGSEPSLEDALIAACLTNQAFDRQLDGSRARTCSSLCVSPGSWSTGDLARRPAPWAPDNYGLARRAEPARLLAQHGVPEMRGPVSRPRAPRRPLARRRAAGAAAE